MIETTELFFGKNLEAHCFRCFLALFCGRVSQKKSSKTAKTVIAFRISQSSEISEISENSEKSSVVTITLEYCTVPLPNLNP
jgi:hypothetical protein